MRGPFRWTEASRWLAGDERWLRQAAGGVAPDESVVDALVDRFRLRFDSVIAYHAGRPADPGSYRARGVLSSSPDRLFAEAREIFPDVEDLLPKQDLSLIDGRLAFNLDERFLLEADTFYMLYGSHFLLGLAVQLRRATRLDAISLLSARGIPTLLACEIPLDHLEPQTLRALCRLSIDALLHSPARTELDFTIHHPLRPDLILSTTHPRGLPDHLYGLRPAVTR
jgi:hypothetical protein